MHASYIHVCICVFYSNLDPIWGEYQFQPVCVSSFFLSNVSEPIKLKLGGEIEEIRTTRSSEIIIMKASAITTQARINVANLAFGQEKSSDSSNILKMEHLFPFIATQLGRK